jgi:protein phosphatase
VERQVRVAPERTWYLVNNEEPSWYTRKCWECGNKHSPPTAQACTYCQAPLGVRRFLMAARTAEQGDAFLSLVERRLEYPTVAAPIALYRHGGQILSIYPWHGENLLLGEPAPLPAPLVLSIGFQLADALSFLHAQGVVLESLGAGNILLAPDGTARLFDLEVDRIAPAPLKAADDPLQPPARDLRELALALSHWCNIDDDDLRRFLKRVQRGAWSTADALGAAISQYSHARRPAALSPRAAAFSDVGLIRSLNEDDWTWRRLSRSVEVYAVADGMGGHEAGEVASQLATRTLVRTLERRLIASEDGVDAPTPPPAELAAALKDAFQAANTAVFTMAGGRAEHMGTTLVALMLVRPDHGSNKPYALVANVGDSRAYRLRAGELSLLTEDHSMVAAMVAAGKITAEEARNHPRANVLLNFLGMNQALETDLIQVDVRAGDRFAVCTDGVWGEVPDSELGRLLQGEPDPRRAVYRVLRAANDAGGRDNASVICLDT